MVYDCEPCQYHFSASLMHANGTAYPWGKFGVAPKEVMG